MADKNSLRNLKIKTNVVKRNMKDFTSYKAEESKLNETLTKMIEEGKDEHDVKQCQECITETSETLATCKPRIEGAKDDLENAIATYEEGDADAFALLKESDEWAQAQAVAAEATAFIENLEI